MASPVAEHRLRTRRLSGHGLRAQPLRGTWDPPGPGLRTHVPYIGRQTLNHCTTREALGDFLEAEIGRGRHMIKNSGLNTHLNAPSVMSCGRVNKFSSERECGIVISLASILYEDEKYNTLLRLQF